jgi:hypothetical protein
MWPIGQEDLFSFDALVDLSSSACCLSGRSRTTSLQAFTVPGLPLSTTKEARVLIGSSGFVTLATMR